MAGIKDFFQRVTQAITGTGMVPDAAPLPPESLAIPGLAEADAQAAKANDRITRRVTSGSGHAGHTNARSLDEAIRETTGSQPLLSSDDVGFAARAAHEVSHAHERVRGKKSLKETLEEMGMKVTEITGKDGKGVKAMVIADPQGNATVAFQGNNIRDEAWKDMGTAPVALDPARPDIKVNAGFKKDADAIYADVLAAIPGNAKRVTLSGHSLGGADATIAAVRLRSDLGEAVPIGVVTFGSPRVGNQRFAEEASRATGGNFVRIVSEQDTTSSLSVRDAVHTAKPIILTEQGITIGNKDDRIAATQNNAPAKALHSMDSYLTEVQNQRMQDNNLLNESIKKLGKPMMASISLSAGMAAVHNPTVANPAKQGNKGGGLG